MTAARKYPLPPVTYPLRVSLPRVLGEWLKDQAEAEGITLTALVTRIIEKEKGK